MNRLIEYTVFSGLTAAWRRASWPTRRSPDLVKATTDGVVRPPSALGMTTGSPASITAMTELVVPRSIPTVFAISFSLQGRPRMGAADAGYTRPIGPLNWSAPPEKDSALDRSRGESHAVGNGQQPIPEVLVEPLRLGRPGLHPQSLGQVVASFVGVAVGHPVGEADQFERGRDVQRLEDPL